MTHHYLHKAALWILFCHTPIMAHAQPDGTIPEFFELNAANTDQENLCSESGGAPEYRENRGGWGYSLYLRGKITGISPAGYLCIEGLALPLQLEGIKEVNVTELAKFTDWEVKCRVNTLTSSSAAWTGACTTLSPEPHSSLSKLLLERGAAIKCNYMDDYCMPNSSLKSLGE